MDEPLLDSIPSTLEGAAGLATIARFAPVGLVLLSFDGRVLNANPALLDILRCGSVDELLGSPISVFHPFPELGLDILLEHLEEGTLKGLDMELVRRDGTKVLARLSAEIIRDGEGHGPLVIGVVEDVTGEREVVEESAQDGKMEAVVRLAAGLAQEYNNLLTGIIGEAHQLREERPTDPLVIDGVDTILAAAKRAAAIGQQLLVFSQSEVARTERIDPNQLVRDHVDSRTSLPARDVEVVCRLDPEVPHIRVAYKHAEQILANLLTNACDAMPAGGCVVVETATLVAPTDTDRLEFRPAVPPGAYVSIAVGDTGIGMNQETQNKIFDPFFTTKPFGTGAGLGLTTVYGLVRRAKGHVSVVSAPGSGTLVKVLLPAHEVDRSVAKSTRSEVAEAQPSRTVLVVDDEATVRRALRRTLERGGYRIIEASDAYVAQHMIRTRDGPIDLLVTDVIMSRMRGTELAQWVSDEHPGIPVLLISGYTDSSLIQEWVDQDPDVFLAKPFEPAELLERVARRLARPTRDASG